MARPRLLDLFCGAGGAAVGYARAGFDVVGVDIEPQPHYPFRFVQADALEVLRQSVERTSYYLPVPNDFAAIHASPICKTFTRTGWAYKYGYHDNHPDLLTPTRELLRDSGVPWVIENVPGAPMRADVTLCGSQFGLGVRRHRLFEFSRPPFALMPPCVHDTPIVSPHGNPNRFKGTAKQWAEAMDIDWMTNAVELSQAIPPAYTEWVGHRLLEMIGVAA